MRELLAKTFQVLEATEQGVSAQHNPPFQFDLSAALDILMKYVDTPGATDLADYTYGGKEDFISAAEQYFMSTDAQGNDTFDEQGWRNFQEDMNSTFESKSE